MSRKFSRLTFSDLQADIAATLLRRNVAVHAFNQRDIAGIFAMMRTLGALVGRPDKAEELAVALEDRLAEARERGALRARRGRRPRVYFEEWDEPMISGLKWQRARDIEESSQDVTMPSRHPSARTQCIAPNPKDAPVI
jgi:ABC-type Fe3+-hydroxamate transport system substrate-binding protein